MFFSRESRKGDFQWKHWIRLDEVLVRLVLESWAGSEILVRLRWVLGLVVFVAGDVVVRVFVLVVPGLALWSLSEKCSAADYAVLSLIWSGAIAPRCNF